ncbi:MAG: hypothetical protein N2235_02435 [Fischerella sp.]|nr:hypothetical protein [Fischerella sp.]
MSLGSLFKDVYKGATTNEYLKTWNHATRLFVDNNYALGPKQEFLYHVFFDINPNAPGIVFKDKDRLKEVGMLVKAVQLPKYTIDTRKYNAYNRPNIIQNKLNYNDVVINFYDDHSDRIVSFWADYMKYYYRDADYGDTNNISSYTNPHKYNQKLLEWGYNIRNGQIVRYLDAIRIYSLHQKRFTEYILVNPIIKQFRHGDHRNNGNEAMECEMTVEFETVLYNFGSVSTNTVKGFADLHYDKTPSYLANAGGSKSFLGPGGLIESGTGIFNDLSSGNLIGAAFKAVRTYENLKDANLKKIGQTEFSEFAKDILRNNNPQSKISVPVPTNIVAGIGFAVEGAKAIQAPSKTASGIPRNPTATTQSIPINTNPPLTTNFGNPLVKSNSESLLPTDIQNQNLPLTGGQRPAELPTPQTINNRNRT